jgi:hypothetical protein
MQYTHEKITFFAPACEKVKEKEIPAEDYLQHKEWGSPSDDMKDLTCSVCGEEILGVLVFVGEAEDWVCEKCSGVTLEDF